MKNMKYVCDRKFTEVFACQKIVKLELGLTKLLPTYYGTVFTHMNI